MFEIHGVKNVITVDPHTTNMLRHVYPSILDDFNLKVRSYLELLAESDLQSNDRSNGAVVVHDSCVYARYEGIIDHPREALRKAGISVKSPELSGSLTHCCGGPIESLFPSRAQKIASRRVEQLMVVGNPVATMCPICLVNLKETAGNNGAVIRDIAEFLSEALFGISRDAVHAGK
jgi:Fe-S oxidoreductase